MRSSFSRFFTVRLSQPCINDTKLFLLTDKTQFLHLGITDIILHQKIASWCIATCQFLFLIFLLLALEQFTNWSQTLVVNSWLSWKIIVSGTDIQRVWRPFNFYMSAMVADSVPKVAGGCFRMVRYWGNSAKLQTSWVDIIECLLHGTGNCPFSFLLS